MSGLHAKNKANFSYKKSVPVLYYSFFERGPNLSEIVLGWEIMFF